MDSSGAAPAGSRAAGRTTGPGPPPGRAVRRPPGPAPPHRAVERTLAALLDGRPRRGRPRPTARRGARGARPARGRGCPRPERDLPARRRAARVALIGAAPGQPDVRRPARRRPGYDRSGPRAPTSSSCSATASWTATGSTRSIRRARPAPRRTPRRRWGRARALRRPGRHRVPALHRRPPHGLLDPDHVRRHRPLRPGHRRPPAPTGARRRRPRWCPLAVAWAVPRRGGAPRRRRPSTWSPHGRCSAGGSVRSGPRGGLVQAPGVWTVVWAARDPWSGTVGA